MDQSIAVGIIGEFEPDRPAIVATEQALNHAAQELSLEVRSTWIPTSDLTAESVPAQLEPFDGLWAAPGNTLNVEGVLQAICFAREQQWPFFGT